MGRGAGNLNLELFADYLNENYGTHYKIEPMLEIMDEYLNDIYQTRFWGYSLPLYLSATTKSHPNYAIYLAEKNSLPVKAFNELLQCISPEDKAVFTQDKAERYYREFMENYLDDKETVLRLSSEFQGKRIVLLAPGRSLSVYREEIENACRNSVVIAVNFTGMEFFPDYVFSSNMRRYIKIQGYTNARCIVTSNMKDAAKYDYMVNFSSYASQHAQIIDNSGLMLLRLLMAAGVKEVVVAGMDGYTDDSETAYYDTSLYYDFSKAARMRNQLISEELQGIARHVRLHFITPTAYCC
jgi:4-hydroxy 2-oxovalerate aldolase